MNPTIDPPINNTITEISPIPKPVCGITPPAVVLSFLVVFPPVVVLSFLVVSPFELFPFCPLLPDVEAAVTVTVQLAFFFPSCEVTVIIVAPTFLV